MRIPLIQHRRISDPVGVSCSAVRLSDRNEQSAKKNNLFCSSELPPLLSDGCWMKIKCESILIGFFKNIHSVIKKKQPNLRHKGALCAPPILVVGCSNMVSLCEAGSPDGCVGLLWAADAQRGQCSFEAGWLHAEMSKRSKIKQPQSK